MRHDDSRRMFLGRSLRTIGLLGLSTRPLPGAAAESPNVGEMTDRAVAFLRSRQASDGSWSGDRKEPGITALVLTAMLRSGRVTANEPLVSKGLNYLEGFIGTKGGLSEAPHSVYSTSVALMAFKEANKEGRYDRLIKGAQDFLKTTQYDDAGGKGRDDPRYGGLGYGGGNSRPDLSNTTFFVEALRDSGLAADDPALKKALVFVSRCQNFKSEFNDQPWADKVNDGGFVYAPTAAVEARGAGKTANGKGGSAAKDANGGLRSLAGMTYSGLKSMLYAGLTQDDPRVKAALAYITRHYTLEENPGQGQRGLYYYYMTFAKAMAMLGKPTLVDSEGKGHDWRTDLVGALAVCQGSSGSWVNPSDGFMEGDANIVTSYGLLALTYARSKT